MSREEAPGSALQRIAEVRRSIERLAQTRLESLPREFEFTEADFSAIRALVAERAGIALSPAKRDMVYVRLSRRLRALGLKRFADYLARVRSDERELEAFINALTTNLTYFFREPHHFEHLRTWLGQRSGARLWSAGCASGEEAYSIAMTACEVWGRLDPPVDILATDLDTQVLEEGRRGIYATERLEALDPRLRARYFEPLAEGRWQIRAELRALVRFARLNFVETPWPVQGPFDAIFCRNVLIYFDRQTQRMIIERFVPLLRPGGHLYLGHSENLLHASEAFEPLGRTIYRRKAEGEPAAVLGEHRQAVPRGESWAPPPRSSSTGAARSDAASCRDLDEPLRPGEPVILIGASTGGTEAIKVVLQALPANAPPVLIVQHMPEHFTASFAKRLDQVCALRVSEARDGEILTRGRAWVGPGHSHLRLERQGAGYVLRLDRSEPVNRHRPSVDVLFFSAAEVLGSAAVAALLTGMGRDGAQGLLALKEAGAHTIAQDEASAVIWGMPGEAVRLGAACEVLPLSEIGPAIVRAVSARQAFGARH
ncbi:MAG: hypothetical protein HZA65_03735 [Rhodocyclales bacterium]|nr:hypothetical protein [Rhodocyclales bacterium]